MITSSSGPTPTSIAAISSAAVHEWVSNAERAPVCSMMSSWHRSVKGPSPDSFPLAIASARYLSSSPEAVGRLNGIQGAFIWNDHEQLRGDALAGDER